MKYLLLMLIFFIISCAKGEYITCVSNDECMASQKICSTISHICEYPKQCVDCGVGGVCNPSTGECEDSSEIKKIQDIWRLKLTKEEKIVTQGVVTAISSNGFVIQNNEKDIIADGKKISSAIYVKKTLDKNNSLKLGDFVIVKSKVNIFDSGIRELVEAEYSVKFTTALPEFSLINNYSSQDQDFLKSYDSMLVSYGEKINARVKDILVSPHGNEYEYEYTIYFGSTVNVKLKDYFMPEFGAYKDESFYRLSGVLRYDNGEYKIFPRKWSDLGKTRNCNPICESWKYCTDKNTCQLRYNRCDGSDNCSGYICNDKHICTDIKKPVEKLLNSDFQKWDEDKRQPLNWKISKGVRVAKKDLKDSNYALQIHRVKGSIAKDTNIESDTPLLLPEFGKNIAVVAIVIDSSKIKLRSAITFLDKNGERLKDPVYNEKYSETIDNGHPQEYVFETKRPEGAHSMILFFRVYPEGDDYNESEDYLLLDDIRVDFN